ncbi:MAG TPA: DUF945 family protein [Woeseiaceae bacterium]|nr:DUF945 family protein [Woeseiaceae bacterium]
MKRWVVVLLVLLAVVLLVSPGIVGQLAERSLKDRLSWAERESADFRVTEEAFDRGWFTAVGRHRIELKHGDLRSSLLKFSGLEASDQVPALIVDTRIDHGLVPFTSMSRQSGSLVPALASTVSTMQLDTGDGEAIHIPGTLYTQVGLTGATASRYLLEPGSFDENDAEATWQGADVSASTDSLRKELSYEGTVEPLSLSTGDSNLGLKQAAFQGNSRYTDFGFMVGAISVDIDEFAYKDGANQAVNIRNLAFNAKSDVADGRVSGKTNVTVNGFSVPGAGEANMVMDVSASRLDAAPVREILAQVRAAQRAPDPDTAMQALYPQVEDDLRTLLASGAEVRIDRFDVSLPQGEVTTRLHFELPEMDEGEEASWAALLLALTASADLRVPVALMDLAQAATPQSGALIAMGILKLDGDSYVVNAQYEKGLLTINGAPMPIPLPGR